MSEIILISVSGRDRPGITAALAGVLSRHDVDVLDIGQAVIHANLAWGMMVDIPDRTHSAPVIRDLVFEAHELDLDLRVTPVRREDYEAWVADEGQPRHIVTLLAPRITARHIAWISELTNRRGLNIDGIQRLSGRRRLDASGAPRRAAIEFRARGAVADMSAMHAEFLSGARDLDADVAIQADDFYRRNRRLVCFDMDSTLVQHEVIDELAAAAGVGEEVAAITAAAMRGEIGFHESFRRRVRLLAGLDAEVVHSIAESLRITEGAERLVATLKRYGYKIAILSGGFEYFAQHLRRRLAIDYVYANELEVRDGKVTGEVVGDVIDEQRKAELLATIAAREGVRLEQVIAVGDGANDLPMLSVAGLGIAFRAKPVVREQARYALESSGLDAILYLLGMRERDFADG